MLSKRHRHPLLPAILFCLLASASLTGCSYIVADLVDPKEWVSIPNPETVAVNKQGQVMLAVFIERETQPSRSGWHWLIVDEQAIDFSAIKPGWTVYGEVELRTEGEGPNAELVPGLLEAGYATADPAEVGGTLTDAYHIEPGPSAWTFYLLPKGHEGPRDYWFAFAPGGDQYAPPIRSFFADVAVRTAMAVDVAVIIPVYFLVHQPAQAVIGMVKRIRD